MIEVNNLKKSYTNKMVINIPHLRIQDGEIVGLVGNNGAGKTTLFRLTLDLIKADQGEVLSRETNVAGSENWKSYTAAYLDEYFLIGYLTPEEYFYFIGKLSNRYKADVDDFLKKFELFFEGSVLNSRKYIRDLSKGNQFKVGIVSCLLQEPGILILDEPFASLDPSSQMRLMKILKELQEKRPMVIFISSHDLNHITEVCSRILLLENGMIIKDLQTAPDTLEELRLYFKV